jgi:fucose 4-O-acetylase-like acetyltransferase
MGRIELIDSLKGYAIILVLLGHVIVFSNPIQFSMSWLFAFIYSFHMPLLLFLSGYLVYQKPIDSKIKFVYKKFKGLILPYFVWLSISIIITNNFVFNSRISDYIIEHVVVYDNIWFLPVLFISFIILLIYIVSKNFLKNYRFEFFTVLLFSSAYILSWTFNPPFQGLLIVRWFSPFVLLGYIAAEYKERIFKKLYIFPLSAVLFALLLPSWSKYVINFANVNNLNLIIDFILAITGIVISYCLIKSLQITIINKFLKFCGIYSLEIYLVSNFLALLLIQIAHVQFWIGNGLLAYLTGTIVFLSISIVFSIIFSYNRYISILLFGRWSSKNINFNLIFHTLIKSRLFCSFHDKKP